MDIGKFFGSDKMALILLQDISQVGNSLLLPTTAAQSDVNPSRRVRFADLAAESSDDQVTQDVDMQDSDVPGRPSEETVAKIGSDLDDMDLFDWGERPALPSVTEAPPTPQKAKPKKRRNRAGKHF